MNIDKIKKTWEDQRTGIDKNVEIMELKYSENPNIPVYISTVGRDKLNGFSVRVKNNTIKREVKADGEHFSFEQINDGDDFIYFWGLKNKSHIEYLDIFANIGNIVAAEAANTNPQLSVDSFIKNIKHYIEFFKSNPKIPSRAFTIGLFGELVFLQKMISHTDDYYKCIEAWKGGHPARDFYFNETVFEIKTSTKNPIVKLKISNENQLDEESVSNLLYLVTISLNPSDPRSGKYLNNLIDEIRQDIKEKAPELLENFNSKKDIMDYGLVSSKKYEDPELGKYSVQEINYFYVTNDFPRIKPSILPIGTSNIKYEIDHSLLLKSFKTNLENIKGLK
ncbi:PD-(D/E)XK motif protein [Pelagibacterales bacterium]|nr:PD-(D/E)XK motif protein [Pelagibacterales bacterium]